MGQIHLGQEELKVRRIGQDAMMEQDAVHIGYEADVTAHLLDTNGKKIGVTGLLDTGAVVSVMPIKTWERMGFTREDLIPTNLRLAAANRGAIYWAGRKPIRVSFLLVDNLGDSDQFILGHDFVRNFDVMIDLNNGLIRIRNPDRKYVRKPNNRNQQQIRRMLRNQRQVVPHIKLGFCLLAGPYAEIGQRKDRIRT